MNLVLDACSVILLAKATVLETMSKNHHLTIGQAVHSEIMAGKPSKKEDALLLDRLVQERKIHVQRVNAQACTELGERYGIGEGESESIALTLQQGNAHIMTDNRQGRKTAKILGLSPLGSPEMIISLFKKGQITKEKALLGIEALQTFGWFDAALIETCTEEIEHGNKK